VAIAVVPNAVPLLRRQTSLRTQLEAEDRTLADVKPDDWAGWSQLLDEDVTLRRVSVLSRGFECTDDGLAERGKIVLRSNERWETARVDGPALKRISWVPGIEMEVEVGDRVAVYLIVDLRRARGALNSLCDTRYLVPERRPRPSSQVKWFGHVELRHDTNVARERCLD
jgi:hypothetical protein